MCMRSKEWARQTQERDRHTRDAPRVFLCKASFFTEREQDAPCVVLCKNKLVYREKAGPPPRLSCRLRETKQEDKKEKERKKEKEKRGEISGKILGKVLEESMQ